MKTKFLKVVAWLLISLGVLVTISSEFIFKAPKGNDVLSVAAIGGLIFLIGISFLILAGKGGKISNLGHYCLTV